MRREMPVLLLVSTTLCVRGCRAPDRPQALLQPKPSHAQLDLDLVQAVKENQDEKAMNLLRHGANPNARDAHGWTSLMLARTSTPELLEELVRHGAFLTPKLPDGDSILYHVRAPVAVRILCARGADPNLRTSQDKYGEPPLLNVLQDSSEEFEHAAVPILLEFGANPNVADRSGTTALMYACAWTYPKVVGALLKHGAKVNVRNKAGKTAINFARGNPDPPTRSKIVAMMKAAGATD
jgi:uncharacterized protein